MSNDVNTRLFERASEQIDYWSGTLHAQIIEQLLEVNDLEGLREAVARAEKAMLEQEYQPDAEPVTDEQIEKLGKRAWTGASEDVF